MKEEIRRILESEGFDVVDYSNIKASVDFVARRGNEVLVVRVLGSMEALKPEHAEDMIKLARMLDGVPIFVTERSRWGKLERDIVYYRYGVPTMSPETFQNYLRGEKPSGLYVRGKEIVPIDRQLLRKRREEMGLSMQKLAELVGTTKETIYRYEKGYYGTIETVRRLEEVLGVKLRTGIEPKPGVVENNVHPPFNILRQKGGRVGEFRRLPWEVLGRRRLIISFLRDSGERTLKRRIALLERGRGSVYHYYLILGKKRRGLPYIEEEEIIEARSFSEIEKIARERNEER